MEMPQEYKTAGIVNLVGGVLNILTAGVAIITLIWFCVGVLWIVPLALGGFQAFIGFQQMNGTRTGQGKIAGICGAVAGLCNLNPLPTLLGVGGFVMSGNEKVTAWLEQKEG